MLAELVAHLKLQSPKVDSDLRDTNREKPRERDGTCTPQEAEDGTENVEVRISRALKDWMPDYTIVSIVPREYAPREPVFSGRLGRSPRIQRAVSTESITTQLSLLSCSTGGKRPEVVFVLF